MKTIKIRSNYHARPLIYWYELTEKERNYFLDLMSNPEEQIFFRYKGNVIPLGDICRLENNHPFPDFWHGYSSDSFFSGILVHLCNDEDLNRLSTINFPDDCIIVGEYFG